MNTDLADKSSTELMSTFALVIVTLPVLLIVGLIIFKFFKDRRSRTL